jgi:hypothetical protein
MSTDQGHVTPESDNARGQAGVIEDQGTAGKQDATTALPFDQAAAAIERDRVAARDALITDLRRRAAVRRYTLHVLDSGELLFAWSGLSKLLADPEAAARWLDHCGVPR